MTKLIQPTFSLDPSDDIYYLDLLDLPGGSIGISVPVYGLLPSDFLVGAAFTAEPSALAPDLTDALPTTLHTSLTKSDTALSGIRTPAVDVTGATYTLCDFLFSVPANVAKLYTLCRYDVRIYVQRLNPDGASRTTVNRIIQRGRIQVRQAVTTVQ